MLRIDHGGLGVKHKVYLSVKGSQRYSRHNKYSRHSSLSLKQLVQYFHETRLKLHAKSVPMMQIWYDIVEKVLSSLISEF